MHRGVSLRLELYLVASWSVHVQDKVVLFGGYTYLRASLIADFNNRTFRRAAAV
jgi:hypothetical protein